MRFDELFADVAVLGGNLPGGETDFQGIVSDSRKCSPGCLFVCIPGERTDGHLYAGEAVARGSACLVVSDQTAVPAGVPYVLVDDTRRAEAFLWNRFCGCPAERLTLFAVTGTNGKTTVTHLLRHILQSDGRRSASVGTLGCECCSELSEKCGGSSVCDKAAAMTTPDPEFLYPTLARMRDGGVSCVVMEASSHALAQHKLEPLAPQFALFTNLSPEHLDYHRTMEAYLSAKALLFRRAERAVLHMGGPFAETMLAAVHCPTVTCAVEAPATYIARGVACLGAEGIRYELARAGGTVAIRSPLPGRFAVENTLLAAAAALEAGVPGATVTEAIRRFQGVRGRLEQVSDGVLRPYTVWIDYAHTPEALAALLRTARGFTAGRLVVLFGCGGDRDRLKRPLMGEIAGRLADFTVLTSDNSRTEDPLAILSDILAGFPQGAPHAVLSDRRAAIAYAVDNARPGDVLLLAGKGHETYEIDLRGMHPFDEAAIALEAMRQRDRR